MQIVIIGSGEAAAQLQAAAVAGYAVNKTVVLLDPACLAAGQLPEALAETVLQVPRPEGAAAWALVCKGRSCLPPLSQVEELEKALA